MPLFNPQTFNLLAALYLIGAGWTLLQLRQQWRSLTDGRLTSADRALIVQAVFFLATPPAVLLHEFGHMLAVWAVGGRVLGLTFNFYWGAVAWQGQVNAYQVLFVALAGNLVTFLLGLSFIPIVGFRPRWRSLNQAVWVFSDLQLLQVLLFYPLLSLVSREGDWVQIYRPATAPLSIAIGLVQVSALLLWLWSQRSRRVRRLRRDLTADPALQASILPDAVPHGAAQSTISSPVAPAGEARPVAPRPAQPAPASGRGVWLWLVVAAIALVLALAQLGGAGLVRP